MLVVGWLLGGNVGAGTLVYALGIGPLVHVTIPWFARGSAKPAPARTPTPTPAPTPTLAPAPALAAAAPVSQTCSGIG